jgi:PST family polysaccharide transporter
MTNTNNIGKESRQGVYWSVLLKIVHQVYYFSVLIIVARILGPKDFGVMALAMTIISYANNLTSFGLTSALVQRNTVSKELIDSVFTFNLALSFILIPLCIYLSIPLSTLLKSPDIAIIIPVLTILFPLTSFYSVPMALLRRNLNFRLHSIIDLIHNFIQSTSMLLLAIGGFGIWSLVYGQIAGFTATAFVIMLLTKWYPKLRINLNSLKDVKEYGFWDLVRSHINYIEDYAAYFIISRFLNPAMLGFFDRATSISDAPLKRIQVQINAVFFSSFSRLQNEPERLKYALNKSITATSIISTPLLVGLAITTSHFVNVLLGSVWNPMVIPLMILSLGGVFKILNSVFRNINIAINAYRAQTVANLASSILYLILCLIGIKWGIIGVAYATLASSLLAFIYYGFLTSRTTRVSWVGIIRSLMPALTGCLVMAIVLIPLSSLLLKGYTITNLILLILAGIVTYVLWILIVPFKDVRIIITDVTGDFKTLLRHTKDKLNK